jgi:hypothetical protein
MNYIEWTLIIKIKLQARNLSEAIEPGDVMLQEDQMVLDTITNAVPQEMLALLAVKKIVAEAWEAVRSLQIGSEAIWNARTQRLRSEFESIQFKERESVDDFTMRLDSLVTMLTLSERRSRSSRWSKSYCWSSPSTSLRWPLQLKLSKTCRS